MKKKTRIVLSLFVTAAVLAAAGCSSSDTVTSYGENELGNNIYHEIINSPVPYRILSQTVEGRDILFHSMGEGDKLTLLVGGFHGSEPYSSKLVNEIAVHILHAPESINGKLVIIPVFNPDGLVNGTRSNANRVDLNRNYPTNNWVSGPNPGTTMFGTAPASEPETQAMLKLLERIQPDLVISVHQPLEVNNYDGPAREIAKLMSRYNGYPVSGDIGYPTPGSFGTYMGDERQIPIITLELPRNGYPAFYEPNRKAILAAINYRPPAPESPAL